MQKKFSFRTTMVSLALMLCWHISADAQSLTSSAGKVILNKEGKMALVSGQALTYNNVLDISTIDFASKEMATEQFTKKNSPLVTFNVDYATKQVTIQIELRAKPDWTLEDWNKYLETL